MSREVISGLLISDFNIGNLSAYLNNSSRAPTVKTEAVPFGQVQQTLLDGSLKCWVPDLDFIVIWTRPEAVVEGFRKLLSGLEVSTAEILEQVDGFATSVLTSSKHAKSVFVPLWVLPAAHPGHGLRDLAGAGSVRVLMQMNLRLITTLDGAANIHALNTQKWIEIAGSKSFNPRLWYMGKVPFGNEVFKAAVADIKSALHGIAGRARKLVIVDLDDTLWGGVVGDGGWQQVVLGGHDSMGEALVDFQRELKALTRGGVILGIVSKNDEVVALDAIDNHPEMVLKRGDFAGWRINWSDKAQNVSDLVSELNLGLDSVVFIDDNPVERDRVRAMLPSVFVPDWPADKRLYPSALLSLDCFDKPADTAEDRLRPAMYALERERSELKKQVGSLADWLTTLEIVVTVNPLTPSDVVRSNQLLNKTNQMNLSTRRMTEDELMAWSSASGNQLWTVRVADKFGDSGLTGIISTERDGRKARIVDFVLSCRVMGRQVEEAMLHHVVEWAKTHQLDEVRAEYIPSSRNRPCLDILVGSKWQRLPEYRFVWNTTEPYPSPPHIKLVR